MSRAIVRKRTDGHPLYGCPVSGVRWLKLICLSVSRSPFHEHRQRRKDPARGGRRTTVPPQRTSSVVVQRHPRHRASADERGNLPLALKLLTQNPDERPVHDPRPSGEQIMRLRAPARGRGERVDITAGGFRRVEWLVVEIVAHKGDHIARSCRGRRLARGADGDRPVGAQREMREEPWRMRSCSTRSTTRSALSR